MMSIEQAEAYLLSLIRPQTARDAPERMAHLLAYLGNPQNQYDIVHVAGTSGKGSTCTIIAALLAAGGARTGLTVSPHLQRMNERIQIDGQPIPDVRFVELVTRLQPYIALLEKQGINLTYFDALLAMALLYWAEERVAIAVVETGIGGRYDGSNVVQPRVAVLTNVGLDHTELLGDTVEEIAADKAAIIKAGTRAVSAAIQPTVRQIIMDRCQTVGAPLLLYERDWSVTGIANKQDGVVFDWSQDHEQLARLKLSLLGAHQAINAGTALTAVSALRNYGFRFDEAMIRQTLRALNVPGRMELLAPDLLIDGAHNPDKMRALVAALRDIYPVRPLTSVVAVKKGKDIAEMMSILAPLSTRMIVTRWGAGDPIADRLAVPVEQLAVIALGIDPRLPVLQASDPRQALAMAEAQREPGGLILVTGSLYLVGEVRGMLRPSF